jgi:hypothetical protein
MPWILIGIQHKMLDPDPDEMNADPQPWLIPQKYQLMGGGGGVFLLCRLT